MNKNEFKKMLKELFRSGEISVSLEYHHSRKQSLVIKIDNEVMFEDEIDND